MNLAELLDATTASALQVAWLRAAFEPVSEPGRRCASALIPFAPGQEAAARARSEQIADFARRVEPAHVDAMREVLRACPDPLPALSCAAMGDLPDDASLLELQRFLDAAARIDTLLETAGERTRFDDDAAHEVAQLLEGGRAGKFGFYLSEEFDPQLAAARARADRAQAEYDSARGRLALRIAQELGRENLPGGEFIVMRDTIASLPQGVRVVREAPTYYLCELELDDAALDALRRRDASADSVALAEEAVRARLASAIRSRVRELEALASSLGEFDVFITHVQFAQEHGCIVAEIADDGPLLRFEEARFLPLAAQLEREGRRYEPISLDLRDVAVLTGPNMGGKSAALRTCGFIATLVSFGIPVPAKAVRSSLFDEIAWLGIGAQEELGSLLSSFAREVVRLKEMLASKASRPLLLVDEFARTTTPHEGKALLVALIRILRRRGRIGLIATHLAGIAAQAGVRHFAVRGLREVPKVSAPGDLQAALDALADSMDYAVIEVCDGGGRQADAIALAHLLGLDDDLVAEAAAVLGAGVEA